MNLAPVLAMVMDYLENITVSTVMYRFPEQTPVVAALAPVFTLLKWILVGTSIALLFFGLVILASRRIISRGGESST